MNFRTVLEDLEERNLSEFATLSKNSKGRQRHEPPCKIRPIFQHDRDRIIHSKAFRRLKHKTQVFLSPTGDHYRTRLTHTLEVSQIARTMAKALRLNEDLTETIALGHDLGHTPFGHAGEAVLNKIHPGGFRHVKQSLRVVDVIEKNGHGLNLSHEVRDGILKHSKGKGEILPKNKRSLASTLEGQLVRLADIIAYVNHDLDDAIRGKVIRKNDIPESITKVLGDTHAKRINKMVVDVINRTSQNNENKIHASEEIIETIKSLRAFLYEKVYDNDVVHGDFVKSSKIITELYHFFLDKPREFMRVSGDFYKEDDLQQSICDFIAGMSDRYIMRIYKETLLPKPWAEF
jgi:dGTPase